MKRILLCVASLLLVGSLIGTARAQDPSTPSDQTMQAPTSNPQSPSTDPTSSTTATSTTDPSSESGTLPATASPWPLVGGLGLASLAAGLLLPRRRAKS